MPDDITRVIARMIDGLRPASSDVRGRPLQQFIAADQRIYLRSEAVTVTVEAPTTPKYDVTKYGRGIYQ
tara:strand:- start:3440 stop:3646 length:207 start_codon:yes stop_codon:yes gene_type:complete